MRVFVSRWIDVVLYFHHRTIAQQFKKSCWPLDEGNRRVLEVGAGRKSRSALFLEANYTSTDVQWHEGIDQLMDVNSIPYRDNSFDLVVCTNVLEHVPTPRRAIGEMHRCLKAGGALFLVVPFLFPVHDIPHDYFRFTEYALLDLLHDWSVVDVRRVYWFGALARYLRLDSFVLYYVVLATK